MEFGQFDKVLDLLYLAAADSSAWTEFLTSSADLFDAVISGLIVSPVSRKAYTISEAIGVDERTIRLYNTQYAPFDCWYLALLELGMPNFVGPGSALCPPSQLAKSEYYNDFWCPHTSGRFQAGIIHADQNGSSVFTLHRDSIRGDFSPDDVRLLEALRPHLLRAFSIHRKVRTLSDSVAAAGSAAAALDVGLIGLAERRKVCFANSLAEALLRSGELLRVRNGVLTTVDSAANQILTELTDGARRRSMTSVPGGSFSVSHNGRTLHVAVLPVSPPPGIMPDQTKVFLTITDPAAVPVTREKILAELFHLTPAEIRVVMMLVKGMDAPEIAARSQTTQGTVRFQLKMIYRKTGTSRQTQLVRLVSKLPGAHEPLGPAAR